MVCHCSITAALSWHKSGQQSFIRLEKKNDNRIRWLNVNKSMNFTLQNQSWFVQHGWQSIFFFKFRKWKRERFLLSFCVFTALHCNFFSYTRFSRCYEPKMTWKVESWMLPYLLHPLREEDIHSDLWPFPRRDENTLSKWRSDFWFGDWQSSAFIAHYETTHSHCTDLT